MSPSKSPLKVVHIIGRLIPGGVEMRTLELVQRSDQSEFKHYIYITSGLEGSLDTYYRAAGAEVLYDNIKSGTFPWSFFKFLRSEAIDVVHSNIMHSSGLIMAIARAAGVPKRIAHFQSDGKSLAKDARGTKAQRYIMSTLIDKCATSIVGLTPTTLDRAWREHWRIDPRCVVVTNGVVIGNYKDNRPPDIMRRFNSGFCIIHVGRGDLPTKNREKAIAVVGALWRKYKTDVQLVFVGRDGSDSVQASKNRTKWASLAQLHSVSDRVTFVGEVSDVPSYLGAADLFLFTSTLEGLPGVVLEARAAGLPIVSSDLPGVQFIAETFPDIRMLRPEAADNEWAEAVLAALTSNSEQRSMRQNEVKGTRYDFEVALQEYEKLWAHNS